MGFRRRVPGHQPLDGLSEIPERFAVAVHEFVRMDHPGERLLEETETHAMGEAGRLGGAGGRVKCQESLDRHGDCTRDAVAYAEMRQGGATLSEVMSRITRWKHPAAGPWVKCIEAR